MSRPYGALPSDGDERPTAEQMHDLYALALKARMWRGAGWLERHFPWDKGEGHCCPPPKLVKGSQERIDAMLAETFDDQGQLR